MSLIGEAVPQVLCPGEALQIIAVCIKIGLSLAFDRSQGEAAQAPQDHCAARGSGPFSSSTVLRTYQTAHRTARTQQRPSVGTSQRQDTISHAWLSTAPTAPLHGFR